MNIIKVEYNGENPRINPEAFDAVVKTFAINAVDHHNEIVYEFETPVTQIGANAFFDNLSIYKITLPDSVESIHPEAFDHVSEMESKLVSDKMVIQNGVLILHFDNWKQEVIIPEGVVEIAPNVCRNFYSKKIVLPSTLKVIGNDAFSGCSNLTSIKFPKGLEKIGDKAFRGTPLGTVTIPDTVKSVGTQAFADCRKLKKIKFGKGVECIGENVLNWCLKLAVIDGKGATADKRALILSNTLLAYAVNDSSDEFVIEEGVNRIGESAFYWAENLKKIILPSTLEDIGRNAFNHCGITEIEIPEHVHTISPGAFAYTKIQKFMGKFASNDHSMLIDNNRLLACKMCNNDRYVLTIPENVTVIEAQACAENSCISEVIWHDNIVSIGKKAFNNCDHLKLPAQLPANLESIGAYAFCDTGYGNFYSLFRKGVIIPAKVKEIDSLAFGYPRTCWFEAEVPPAINMKSVGEPCRVDTIYVPVASVDAYKKAFPDYADKIIAWER